MNERDKRFLLFSSSSQWSPWISVSHAHQNKKWFEALSLFMQGLFSLPVLGRKLVMQPSDTELKQYSLNASRTGQISVSGPDISAWYWIHNTLPSLVLCYCILSTWIYLFCPNQIHYLMSPIHTRMVITLYPLSSCSTARAFYERIIAFLL